MGHGGRPNPNRHYTELCNRSRSSPNLSRPTIINNLEDYWQDASVSLKACHSREDKPPAAAFSEDHARAKMYPTESPHDEFMVSVKRHRTFPPPLTSCTTLSIKGGGRFVLMEMVGDHRPQGFFRAERENGRLRLHLVLPDEVAATAAHDGFIDDDVNDLHLESCISHDDGGQGDFENANSAGEACKGYPRDNGEGIVGDLGTCRNVLSVRVDGGSVDQEETSLCHAAYGIYHDGNIVGEEVSTSYGGIFELKPANLKAAEGSSSLEQGYAAGGQQHHQKIWNVDINSTKGVSLGLWPPSQLLVSQPLGGMRPALGLAMS